MIFMNEPKKARKIKKVAAINDLSGSSRCSLTVAMPVIGAMGIQCCVLPTAILSNHTGYRSFYFEDFTDGMEQFAANWQKQNLRFDCIYSGFLGSDRQIEIVERFIDRFADSGTKILIDPVMGDNGKIYSTYTEKMCSEMKKLAAAADVITPNITEACVLSGTDYKSESIDESDLRKMAEKIAALGAKNVVITGIINGSKVSNYIYRDGESTVVSSPLAKKTYSGTGDLFASVVCGMITNGSDIISAVKAASDYTAMVTQKSCELGIAWEEGVCFELFMEELCRL